MFGKLAAIAGAAVASLLAIPLLLSGGGQDDDLKGAAAVICVYGAPDPARAAAAYRLLATDGDYAAVNGDRSGAYLMTIDDWTGASARAGYDPATYPAPTDAEPDVQDAVAVNRFLELLQQNDGSLLLAAVQWHHGTAPADDDPAWVTADAGGETLSAWAERFLSAYATDPYVVNAATAANSQVCGAGYALVAPIDATTQAVGIAGSAPVVAPQDGVNAAVVGSVAFPLPKTSIGYKALGNAHHDYAAIDIMVATGTPVFAATAGTVSNVHNFGRNWFEAGCKEKGVNGCATCGVGVTVQDASGVRWTYCHLTSRAVNKGDTVTAGQQLGASGNTGRSGGPHLHIELNANDVKYCPQTWLQAVWNGKTPPAPKALPQSGCSF